MEGLVALAEMLSRNKSLLELNLACHDIPEAGLKGITRGLLQNTSHAVVRGCIQDFLLKQRWGKARRTYFVYV